ncbi:xylulokinase [Staphylococcus sp. 11262D007BW]
MNTEAIETWIEKGQITVGIEIGSTRIKTVAITPECQTIATGIFEWENQFKNGYWTYDLDEMWHGIQQSYADMARNITKTYHLTLTRIASLGISGMMHGYLVFDQAGTLLAPFRTWRNNNANHAAEQLRTLFEVNIPERWSIAQLYQSILDQETHVKDIDFMTTLAGYVHWRLTGKRVLGIGDASGMFPIDNTTHTYRSDLCDTFNQLLNQAGYAQHIEAILPEVCVAGVEAGQLTEAGARALDPTGHLLAGCPLCPPEGDAQTGMVATDSTAPRSGNVSVGTSIFAMLVLERPLSQMYPDVDIVTTPDGNNVAMIHANNGTSELDQWMSLFGEVFDTMGITYQKEALFTKLLERSLEDTTALPQWLSYGYISGEFITDVPTGYPAMLRTREGHLSLTEFMQTHLMSLFSTLKIGVDLLVDQEDVQLNTIVGHGGLFKTPNVAQFYLANALESPVRVIDTASEGGAWGIAVLARYLFESDQIDLTTYLHEQVFQQQRGHVYTPKKEDIQHFRKYVERFKAGLPIQQMANAAFKGD